MCCDMGSSFRDVVLQIMDVSCEYLQTLGFVGEGIMHIDFSCYRFFIELLQ
jgi:hypothetical protein